MKGQLSLVMRAEESFLFCWFVFSAHSESFPLFLSLAVFLPLTISAGWVLLLSMSLCLSLDTSVPRCPSVCVCVPLSVSLSLTLSELLWLFLSLSWSVSPDLYVCVCVCICLSLSISLCLCLRLSGPDQRPWRRHVVESGLATTEEPEETSQGWSSPNFLGERCRHASVQPLCRTCPLGPSGELYSQSPPPPAPPAPITALVLGYAQQLNSEAGPDLRGKKSSTRPSSFKRCLRFVCNQLINNI